MGTQLPLTQTGRAPQFSAHVYCGLSPGHIVLNGDLAPLPKKWGRGPQFSAHVYFGQLARWTKDATWYGDKPRPRPHCARWGPSSHPRKGHSPQYSAHVDCSQTAGCIRIALGMEAGLSLGDIVLHGDPSPKGVQPPNFRSMSVVAKQLDGLRCYLVWQ